MNEVIRPKRRTLAEILELDPKQDAMTMLLIIVVGVIHAIAVNGFYVPHKFLSSGITGVALLLTYLLGIPTWISVLALNIPICIIGFKYLKPKLVIFSFIAVGVFTVVMALTSRVNFGIKDSVLAALAGGAMVGIPNALVVRRDATMGGIDVITLILSRRYSVSMGTYAIAFNLVIMGILAVYQGLELGIVSILAMCACNMAFDATIRGLNRTVTVFIISDKWDEIAPLVMAQLHRGVTYIPAEGGYTGAPKKLVYCLLRPSELFTLKRIVRERDKTALFSMIETKEVIGRGFSSIN
ncbi:MAG: YitT family protein [Clostridia bacterium]